MEEFWAHLQVLALDFAGRGLGAALLLAVGWLALRFGVEPVRRLLDRSRLDPSVASFLVNSARSVLMVVVILGVLQQLGMHTGSLLTLLGTVGIAVALALQGSLANFASGLLVLAFRVAKVGDVIETGDVHGRVAELLPFHVVLITPDNQRVTVPNTQLTTAPVRNHSVLATRRVQWTLPLTPRDDLNRVKEALRTCLQAERRLLHIPPPELFLQEWTEDKRMLVVQAWTATADYQPVQQDLLEVLGFALESLRRSQNPPAASA